MERLLRYIIILAALALASCGGNSTPTTPAQPPIIAQPAPPTLPAPPPPAPVILAEVVYGVDPGATRSTADIRLNLPEDAVQTADGSIYVTDTHSHVIRRIKDGVVTVFAGSFLSGYNGDGLKANTNLNLPTALMLSSDGASLLFADSGNYLLRKIDLASGRILTIAGQAGRSALPSDGVLAKDGTIGWVSTLKLDKFGNIWFPSTHADPVAPEGGLFYISTDGKIRRKALAVPGGLLSVRDIHLGEGFTDFIRGREYLRIHDDGRSQSVVLPADAGKGILAIEDGVLIGAHTAVMKLDNEFKLSTLAGGFANVSNIKKLSTGYLVVDSDQGVLYSFDGKEKKQLTGFSEFTDGALVSVIKHGTGLLILDNQRAVIWKVDPVTGKSILWAGTGTQGWASIDIDKLRTSFYYPNGIAADAEGNVYVIEQHRVMKIGADGQVKLHAGYETAGDLDSTNPIAARFRSIGGIAFDATGNMLVADTYNNKIRKVTPSGVVTTIAGTGRSGKTTFGVQGQTADLNRPSGILPLADGSVLIADSWNNTVHKLGTDGIIRPFAGKVQFTGYQGNGSYSGDGGPAVDAGLNTPVGMSLARDGSVFIADQFNHRIRKVTPDGKIQTFAGGSQGFAPQGKLLNFPNGMMVSDQGLYVADSGNRIILRYKVE